ncbi:transglutaminase domain-containing protein [Hymenobacter sp. 15J16-1T3B]|uniref:transglutaminase-like domain-containing protein n=1 Tax=Hymenobacter sp. 15J16-1T3B TaxID=2886941 RepID=UPI001D11CE15|nr:transglutaminase domain-containing protein [Hymenobacter sp. 15J16-1T3B]MCC3157467.1 transglutaminase domain-containing protein [Hymenobacter sp. 15J16-1T3B]
MSLLVRFTPRPAGLLAAAASLLMLTAASPIVPRVRTFAFDYQTTVAAAPAGAKALDLWLPVPHDDASQDVAKLKIDAPYPYEVRTGEYGNKMLHLRVSPAPAQPFAVALHCQVTRREHINPLLPKVAGGKKAQEPDDPNLSRWLAPDRLVPLDDSIRVWALRVTAQAGARTDLDRARAIYNHVVSTVKYDKSGQGWGRGDIYYACDARRGNCTDFHALFIGYCRALGIPARFSIGFPLPPERGAGEVKGYHCWAEFYTKQTGWVPIDASEAAKNPDKREYFFGHHDENRVELTRGRDLTLTPRQQGEPLNYFVYPYAEVDGQPFTSLTNQFRYRDATE